MGQSDGSDKFQITIGWECDDIIEVAGPRMDQSDYSAKLEIFNDLKMFQYGEWLSQRFGKWSIPEIWKLALPNILQVGASVFGRWPTQNMTGLA